MPSVSLETGFDQKSKQCLHERAEKCSSDLLLTFSSPDTPEEVSGTFAGIINTRANEQAKWPTVTYVGINLIMHVHPSMGSQYKRPTF